MLRNITRCSPYLLICVNFTVVQLLFLSKNYFYLQDESVQYLLRIIYCSFGAFFYDYDSGLTTSIIRYPEFIEYFGFNATTLGALGSAYYAGNFVGSLCNVWLPDKYGRLNVVRFASVVSILGAGMQTGAHSLAVLLAGRAIGGIACGIPLCFLACT